MHLMPTTQLPVPELLTDLPSDIRRHSLRVSCDRAVFAYHEAELLRRLLDFRYFDASGTKTRRINF